MRQSALRHGHELHLVWDLEILQLGRKLGREVLLCVLLCLHQWFR
jgi:hypothetical protein